MKQLSPLSQTPSNRLLLVLSTLAQSQRPMTANELIQSTRLARSTIYRQLAHLKQWGFVQDNGETYAPGPVGVQLGQGFDAASPLVSMARAEMGWLTAQSGESVGLVVAVNDHVVCLEMIESSQALRCSFEKGRSVLLSRGASAKCLLAHQTRAQRLAWSQKWAGDPASYPQVPSLDDLEAIRSAGYACSTGEVDAGVWGVSAPIFGKRRRAMGALTLMAPVSRAKDREQQLIQLTVIAATRVSRRFQSG